MRALKRLGQNFLVEPAVASYMTKLAEIDKSETVLEIGPGKGIITRQLAKKAKTVYAIEKDHRLARYLLGLPRNVELIWGDALKTEWPKTDKLVANLPFNISSKVVLRVQAPIKIAILGLQKEFAKRMIAKPGSSNYGRLSVTCNLLFDAELKKVFPSSVFEPRPEVELGIVKLVPKELPKNWDKLEIFIRDLFCYPGKNTDNALKLAGFDKLGIDKKVRELEPKELIEMWTQLSP
ncbi:MAG: ribosomal RNA small subunit methyltransferase A [Candidatus Altiarchaeota archaeon]|nr:ribosomal RNA small subunit methyltransferase A [Candidatus Altiarchaeota archaeon]